MIDVAQGFSPAIPFRDAESQPSRVAPPKKGAGSEERLRHHDERFDSSKRIAWRTALPPTARWSSSCWGRGTRGTKGNDHVTGTPKNDAITALITSERTQPTTHTASARVVLV